MAQKNKGVWWRKYKWQLNKALQRGIPWRMTFEEWCEIWRESGKWEQRGIYRGQYVMARFGDQGAYERSNIRICLVAENVVENTSRLPVRGFCTPEIRARRWAGHQKKPKPPLVRPASSIAAMGHRVVIRDGVRRWSRPGDDDYSGQR